MIRHLSVRPLLLAAASVAALAIASPAPAVMGAVSPRAAVTASTSDPVIAAAGDIACEPGKSATAKLCRYADVGKAIAAGGYDAVLALGDQQYTCGTLSQYMGSYDKTWGAFLSSTLPAPGDQDYASTCGTATDAGGYWSYFGDRATPGQAGCRSHCQGWYSTTVGSWKVVVLNGQCTDSGVGGCSASSPQGRWLADELSSSPGCTLAVLHEPYFGNGRIAKKYKPLFTLLDRYGVDVLLTGHIHYYARFAPSAPDASRSASGVRQFIVGTGGRSHSKLASTQLSNFEAGNATTYGFLELSLHSSSYDWRYRSVVGSYSDSGSASCV